MGPLVASLLMAASAATGQACAFDPEEGSLVHTAKATPQFEARNAPEFADESFAHDGATYRKTGLPRRIAPFELDAFDLISDVPLFIAAGDYQTEAIYLMVSSADCLFQRYEKDQEPGGGG
jgi:hypothetical protein